MAAGYRVEIIYLKIDSPQLALKRIAARVRQGGHDVRRAARRPRDVARMHGTPIYVMKDGKVVALKP